MSHIINIDVEEEDIEMKEEESAVFSPTKTGVLKTIAKGLSVSGTAMCCWGAPALGCAVHSTGELLETVVDSVQSNLEETSEQATNLKMMKMLTQIQEGMQELNHGMDKGFKKLEDRLDDQDEKIKILQDKVDDLQDKVDDQPSKKKKRYDPNEKISCPECDGEFSACNISKHLNRIHPKKK